jgi:hypothetical protein
MTAPEPPEAPRWQPANDTERALATALARDDRAGFFQVVADADLYLPQRSGSDATGQEQDFVTVALFGQTVLPVFTSIEGLAAAMAGLADAYTVTSYPELCDKWPVPQWRLAVNPGSPIDAYLPVEAVEAAARGELVVPTAGEAIVDAAAEADPAARAAALDPHQALVEAASQADPDGYVDALLDCVVVVPTAREVSDPQPPGPDFPWRPAGPAEDPAIEVFTSAEAFTAAYPEQPGVTMPFVILLTAWPDGHALAVNPGGPAGLVVPADQVHQLLLWATPLGPTPKDPGEPA